MSELYFTIRLVDGAPQKFYDGYPDQSSRRPATHDEWLMWQEIERLHDQVGQLEAALSVQEEYCRGGER